MSECKEDHRTLVLNDLLSYTWCNLELCQEEKLLTNLQNFYSNNEAVEAFKTLLKALTIKMRAKLIKKIREPNPFLAIIKVLKKVQKEELPIFVCKDLNNIPVMEVVENKTQPSGKLSFSEEHCNIKTQIIQLFNVLSELKDQCEALVHNSPYFFEENSSAVAIKTETESNFITGIKREAQNWEKLETSSSAEEDINNFEELDEDREGESLSIVANRLQRTSARCARRRLKLPSQRKKGVNCVTNSKAVKNHHYENSSDFCLTKIIHISNEEEESSISVGSSFVGIGNKEDSNEDNVNVAGKDSFLIVEQVFDENVGHFTVYKCSYCNFSSNDEATAIMHECYQKLSHQKNLMEDPEELTSRPGYTCHECKITFKMINNYKAHKETHYNTDHQCPLCLKRFIVEEWLQHVRHCSGNDTTAREDHYCPSCDVFFADKRILFFHRAYHDISRPFECLECKFRFYTQKAVANHFRCHLVNQYKLKCPFCYFRADKRYKVQEHIRCHTGDRPYKCHLCDHRTTTFGALKTHIRTHDPRRYFTCDICDKSYKSNNKLVNHKRIHTSEKPHKCPICGKGFKFGMQMTVHHRTHLDIRNFPCPQCPYRARSAAILKGHLNTHSNAKPFQCPDCDFRANHKSYLNFHIKCRHPKPEDDP